MPVDAGTIFSEIRVELDALRGDVRAVNAQFDKIVEASNNTGGKSQSAFQKFFSFINSIGVASFASLNAIIGRTAQFLGESIGVATDAQETYSKFNTIFDSISESANQTADAFADSFDLAGSTARQLLGNTADLLSGFGATAEQALSLSERVNTLAGDLASFSNIQGGTEQASRALTAALLGEREQAKQLGIVIRQTDVDQELLRRGQENLTGEAKLLATAEATLALAIGQSQNAIGDYARTQDSAANAQRRLEQSTIELQEAVGNRLLPAVTFIRNAIARWNEGTAEAINNAALLRSAYDEFAETGEQLGTLAELEERRAVIQERLAGATQFETLQLLELLSATDRAISQERQRIALEQRALALQAQGDEAAAEAAALAAEEAAREAERQAQLTADREFRIATEERLQEELFRIAQAEELAADRGEEFNAALERQQAVQQALNTLFEQGFRFAGDGVQQIITRYGEFLDVTEENKDAQVEFFQAVRDANAEILAESQELFSSQLALSGQATEEQLRILFEQGRISLEQYEGFINEFAERQRILTEELINNVSRYVTTAGGLFSGFFTAINQDASNYEQAELNRLQNIVDNTEEGTDAREAAENQLDARRREIARETAEREKALRSFQVVIDTAAAVLRFLVDPGGPAGVALSVGAGITGIAQLAAVNSAPIPNFQFGGVVPATPGGRVVRVAENGADELLLNGGASGTALLDQFAQRIAAAIGGSRPQVINVPLVIDGEPVARASARVYNDGRVRLNR